MEISSDELLSLLQAVVPLYRLPSGQLFSASYRRVSREESIGLEAVRRFIQQGNHLEDVLAAVNLQSIRDLREILVSNMDNGDEDFWHQTFKKHTWALEQLFSLPSVYMGDKVYVGGKKYDRRGGNEIDFILKNPVTRNVGVVEIKTPMQPLIGRLYRNNTYTASDDVTGGLNQLLVAKEALQKNYLDLFPDGTEPINPHCILLVGKVAELEPSKKHNLEIFRGNSRDVAIVGYDELLVKVEALITLMTSTRA
jgi:hypothetical protein